MGYAYIGQLWNIMCRCKDLRFQKSLWKFDLWRHGTCLLMTVPSVGKSSRLWIHLPAFVPDFHHHAHWARGSACLNAAQQNQKSHLLVLYCQVLLQSLLQLQQCGGCNLWRLLRLLICCMAFSWFSVWLCLTSNRKIFFFLHKWLKSDLIDGINSL